MKAKDAVLLFERIYDAFNRRMVQAKCLSNTAGLGTVNYVLVEDINSPVSWNCLLFFLIQYLFLKYVCTWHIGWLIRLVEVARNKRKYTIFRDRQIYAQFETLTEQPCSVQLHHTFCLLPQIALLISKIEFNYRFLHHL